MAKFTADAVLDAALAKVATCTRLSLCTALPANFAGIAALSVGNVVLTAGIGSGDYTVANGDVSGRKLTVATQASIPIVANGSINHVVLDDGSTLLQAMDCTTRAVLNGDTVTTPAYDIEFADITP